MKEVLVAAVRIPPRELQKRKTFTFQMERRWYVARVTDQSIRLWRLEGLNDLETKIVARMELEADAPF